MTYRSEDPDLTKPDPGIRTGTTEVLETAHEKTGRASRHLRVSTACAAIVPLPSSAVTVHEHALSDANACRGSSCQAGIRLEGLYA